MKKSETHDAITRKCTIKTKIVKIISPSESLMKKHEIIGKAIQEGIKEGLKDNRLLQDYALNRKVKQKIEGVSK